MPSEPALCGAVAVRPAPDSGTTLEAVLDHYLQELAEGRTPDQGALLQSYPELADALRGVFKTLDFVEATSRALRAMPLECGQALGEYRIVREVARGGMGVVYEAVQSSLNRRVALKVLPTGALLSQTAPERFVREAQAAAQLHHTNIVPVYAIGEEHGIHYYVMQFIEGRSLADYLRALRREEAVPDREYFVRVARWGQQVAEALNYAHAEGTIHRDIKPSNLLLDGRDNVWITDFGLARADAQTTLTVSGDIVGTARYMSPEQARGGRPGVDFRTDIYSLGVTLYELLALAPAFDGESREDVLNQIACSEAVRLRRRNPAIPRDLETVVGKCMEKMPERRYARAADLAEDCRRFNAGEPIRARRTSVFVKGARLVRRHRLHTIGALVAVTLAVTSLGLVLSLRHLQGQRRVDAALSAILYERDAPRAVRLLDEAHALGVDSAELHLYRGLTTLLFGQPQRSIAALNEALRRDSQHVDAALALTFAYSSYVDQSEIRRRLALLNLNEIKTPLGWLLHGMTLRNLDEDGAIESFDHAIALRPDFLLALEERAVYRENRLLVRGVRADLEPMLRDFDAWVVFRPTAARSYAARGMGLLMAAAYGATQADLREPTERWLLDGRADLERAVALAGPKESVPWVKQAAFLEYVGDFQQAGDACARAIEIDRAAAGDAHQGYVHYDVIARHALGEFELALREIEPACASLPDFWALALQRAMLLAELGRVDEARTVGRACLERYRDSETGLLVTAFLELLGDVDAAGAFYREFGREHGAATSHPYDAWLRYLADELDAAELLAGVGEQPGKRCEAAFLVALRELGRGNRDDGQAAVQACLHTGVFTYVQHRLSQVMYARLQQEEQWPPWIPARLSP